MEDTINKNKDSGKSATLDDVSMIMDFSEDALAGLRKMNIRELLALKRDIQELIRQVGTGSH